MVYNKELNISEENIFAQKDIAILAEWKEKINFQIIQIKTSLGFMEEGSARYICATSAKRYMNVLQEVIIMQMKCVKYENNKELLLMRKFMKAAKTE